MEPSPNAITSLLIAWSHGDEAASDQLFSAVYDELRRMARSHLRHERSHHTLLSRALVNEAYLRLVDQQHVNWQNRAQFFGLASQMMRRILINYAIERGAEKRGGGVIKLTLDAAIDFAKEQDVDLIALDDALKTLETLDPRQCRIVELRFFGGLTVEETAEVLHLSPAAIYREWKFIKLWLHNEISRMGEQA